MSAIPFTPPQQGLSAFNCPYCGAFSHQLWSPLARQANGYLIVNGWMCALCGHCAKMSLWLKSSMIFPENAGAPLPNPHLPVDIVEDYEEARSILSKSPRGAAALLRLAVQKLCVCLGEKGKNINDDIAALVAKGLPSRVQQALDTVRVIGNEAVHPGQIDLNDNPEIAASLFGLLNFISEKMIGEPAEVQRLYDLVPESKKRVT